MLLKPTVPRRILGLCKALEAQTRFRFHGWLNMEEEHYLGEKTQHVRETQYMSVEVTDQDKHANMVLPDKSRLENLKHELKLVALDLDGTTLREDKTISTRTIKVLDKLQEKGVTVAICSGRAPESVTVFGHAMHLDNGHGYCVCFNGGSLINLSDIKKDLYVSTLDAQDLIDIEAVASKHKCAIHAYSTRRVLLTESNIKFTEMEIAASMQPFEKLLFPKEVKPYERAYKLIAVGDAEKLDAMRADLPEDFPIRFNIARTHPNFLEFMIKGCSKGVTLQHLCEKIGITMDNVVSFGDAENDIEMVQMAGVGVAMANAMDTLKAVTPYRAYNYLDDGVAIYLEQLFGLEPQI